MGEVYSIHNVFMIYSNIFSLLFPLGGLFFMILLRKNDMISKISLGLKKFSTEYQEFVLKGYEKSVKFRLFFSFF